MAKTQEIGFSRLVWAQSAATCPTVRGAWRLRVKDGKATLACITHEVESEVVLPCVAPADLAIEGRVGKMDTWLALLRLEGTDFVTAKYRQDAETGIGTLKFNTGASGVSFKLQPWLEGMFPDMQGEAQSAPETMELETEELANALAAVIPAMQKSGYRYAFQAVHVFSESGKLCFEATDGVWLARYEMPLAGVPELDMVIPADTAKPLLAMLRRCGGEVVTFAWTQDFVELRTNTHRVRGLLYADRFPDTAHIRNKRPGAGYRVQYSDLVQAVRFVRALIAHDRLLSAPAYGLWFVNDKDLYCRTEDSSGGSASVTVPYTVEGDLDPALAAGPCFVTLQARIVNAVLAHKAESLWLGYTGKASPMFVEFGEGAAAPLYVVSPLTPEQEVPIWITGEGESCTEAMVEMVA